jgi:hypothetical protein
MDKSTKHLCEVTHADCVCLIEVFYVSSYITFLLLTLGSVGWSISVFSDVTVKSDDESSRDVLPSSETEVNAGIRN